MPIYMNYTIFYYYMVFIAYRKRDEIIRKNLVVKSN